MTAIVANIIPNIRRERHLALTGELRIRIRR